MAVSTSQRGSRIARAAWFAAGGNLLLAAGKIVVGLISGSLAVLADGFDSLADVATSVIAALTAPYAAKPRTMTIRGDTVVRRLLRRSSLLWSHL